MRIHSLTTRFVLTLLLSTAVPFLVFGWIVRVGMRARLEEQVVRVLLEDKARLGAEWLDALTEQMHRNCSLLEPAASRLLDGSGAAELEDELDLQVGFHTDFQLVLVAGEDGRLLASVAGLGLDAQRRQSRAALLPEHVRDEDWFQRTVEGGESLVWIDRHLSRYLHRNPDKSSLDPGDFSLGIAFLVLSEDASSRGVVLALLPWQRVQQILDDLAAGLHDDAQLPSAQAMLCARDGTVLASFARDRYSRLAGPPALIDAIETATPMPDVVRYRADSWRLAASAEVDDTGFGGLDWRIVIAAPEHELFAASRDFGHLLLLLTAGAAAILVAWSLFASRAILRPVRELSQATGRLAAGDLEARVRVRGQDELAELGRSFNAMASDLAESRERLRDAERQAAWAEMARQVAHEIKNPLTPMRMSAQLVQRARAHEDPRLPQLVDRLAHTVLAQTEQLARIAGDFRQFAGTPRAQRERVHADVLLDEVERDYAAFAEDRGVELVVERGAGDAVVDVDHAAMRGVFSNLLKNAFEAVEGGGRIEVRAAAVATDGGSAAVEFTVRDSGSGIPPDAVDKLFEPYFTTRSAGTGLGLAICRRLVEAHGGRLWLVGSTPGATEFRFTIPRAPDDDAA